MKTFATARRVASRARGLAARSAPAADSATRQPPQIRNILHGPRLQAKLEVGAANDPLEREADRVADEVMRMPDPGRAGAELQPPANTLPPRATPPTLRRLCTECEEELHRKEQDGAEAMPDAAPPIVHEVLRGPGRPLDATTRAFFEPRFGRDLSSVRVHAGGQASASASAVAARAYTVGNDVVFRQGAYAPASIAGRRLLAHELAHVAQQGRAPVGPRLQRACGQALAGTTGCRPVFNVNLDDVGATQDNLFRFVRNCDDLRAGVEQGLRDLASRLNPYRMVEVHGFASSEGTIGFNLRLSCARARRAASILEAEGVPQNRIRIIAHGEVPGRRPDRRSVVIVSGGLAPGPAAPAPATPPAPTPVPAGPPFHTSGRIPDRSGGGSTEFQETVEDEPTVDPEGVITGEVTREEFAPPVPGGPGEQLIHHSTRRVRFDPSECRVTLPYAINFVSLPVTATSGFCTNTDASLNVARPALPPDRVRRLGDQYLRVLNEGLNGWYSVRIGGGECRHDCAGQDMEIRVEVTRAPAGTADQTVAFVNRAGRDDSGHICIGDGMDNLTSVHEGGHQALGVGDEYRESDRAVRRRNPTRTRDERVRSGGLSYMSSQGTYGRFSQFHERHFRHVQTFLEAALRGTGCDSVDLIEGRSQPPDFRLSVDFGGAFTSLGGAFSVGVGVGLGIPLARDRSLMLVPELRARIMSIPAAYRGIFLGGLRLGLMGETSPGNFSLFGGGFVEGGVSVPFGGSYAAGPSDPAPYGELGGTLGISEWVGGGVRFSLQGEAALGSELRLDAEGLQYFRLGVRLGLSF